tara:strand:+ start:225 stop:521 length:297 start_codon:yes stop_codon:yes gene_type:complete
MAKKENPMQQEEKELVAKRQEITKYYKDNIPHLKTQLQYEELLRDIEKTRAERMQAQMFMAKSQAAPPAPQQPEKGITPEKVVTQPVKRTLKKAESND